MNHLADDPPVYPPRAAKKPIVHSAWGDERPDDYHWLRTQGKDDPEVLAYLQAENDYLQAVMAQHQALQDDLYQELVSHLPGHEEKPPIREGDWWYFQRWSAGLAYPIHVRRHVTSGQEQVLLDLDALRNNEGHANVWLYRAQPSPDGRYWAFILDTSGQEIFELRILDTETGELAEAPLQGVGGWGRTLVWTPDGRQLIYVTDDDTGRPYRVWKHALGMTQRSDQLLFEESDPRFRPAAHLSETGESLLIGTHSRGADEWFVIDTDKGEPRLLFPRRAGVEIKHVTDGGSHWLVLTNQGGATEFKLVSFPKRKDARWSDASDIMPHQADRFLTGFQVFKQHLLVTGRQEGLTQFWVLSRSGDGYAEPRRVDFGEGLYTVNLEKTPDFQTDRVNVTRSSLTRPQEYGELDLNSRQYAVTHTTPVPNYDPVNYLEKRVWATGADGTSIPISLIHHRETSLPAPTVLYGYGSYGTCVNPVFQSSRLALLNRGWVWAIAHVRGGSELGRHWYDQGKLTRKQNTFSDFIAAGEHLKTSGIASELVARGASAGGLLTATVVNQRPEMWEAAILGVPFVDVISTMVDPTVPLVTNEYGEWGNPAHFDEYQAMRAYSPYDQLTEQAYPHLFITAGLNDPRVPYWEPAKHTAKLRDVNRMEGGKIVLKTHLRAGHFGSADRFTSARETAEEFAFIIAATS